MKKIERERIKELEFEYKGTKYRFDRDDLEYLTEYGCYATVCEIPISITKYANDKEVIECICKMALSIYGQGVCAGMQQKEREIRKCLGIRE